MTLSLTSPIRCSDIMEVVVFKDMKVYLLRGVDDSELVIKIDAVFDKQIKSTGVAVKALDPSAKMKIMTASERQELSTFCRYWTELDAYYEDWGIKSPLSGDKEAIEMLKESLTFPEPFAKMNKQTIHDLQAAADHRGGGNKAVVRVFVSSLKADGGLERLGQVVAGDLFNGNTDRFNPYMKKPKELSFGPFTVTLRVLVNPGNVMLVSADGKHSASMLDYVDPNSLFKHIDDPLTPLEKQFDEKWPGRVLADKKARHNFAKLIIEDLESILHPKKSLFSMKTKLGRNAASRLEAGMIDGARLIKRRLETKYNPNRWTAGTKERYQIIAGA